MCKFEITCLICKKNIDSKKDVITTVKRKGILTLKNASIIRGDDLHTKLAQLSEIILHKYCQLRYTRARDLKSIEVHNTQIAACNTPVLRSNESDFDFKTNCFICGQEADIASALKYAKNRRDNVQLVTLIDVKEKVLNKAREKCLDSLVRRLNAAIDLIASDARYHRSCYKELMYMPEKTKTSDTGEINVRDNAFIKLCNYIEENDDCQFSLPDLTQKLTEFSLSEEVYGQQYLQSKLEKYYGDDVIILKSPGKPNILVHTTSFAKVVHDNWYTEKKDNINEEKIRIVKAAAAIIYEDMCSLLCDCNNYSKVSDDNLEQFLPETLLIFLNNVIVGRKKSNDIKVKIASIAHAIMSAARPRSFLSNMQVCFSIWLHKMFGSKMLIDMVSKLAFGCTYNEIQNFESAACEVSQVSMQNNGFVQFIFDNADINQCTLTGSGTFHCLGGIMCITPAASAIRSQKILRKACGSAGNTEFIKIELSTFNGKNRYGMQNQILINLPGLLDLNIKHHIDLDRLPVLGKWLQSDPSPSWSGYMTSATASENSYEISDVSYLPFIRLSASNPSAIYSALLFAERESKRLKQDLAIVTFDQPLFIIANEIILAAQTSQELLNMHVRLGGFHMLMSFLGSIGYVMTGSGLEEVWSTVYAKNSVPHMISGKAVARAIRAHLLTDDALVSVLLDIIKDKIQHLIIDIKKIHLQLQANEITVTDAFSNAALKEVSDIIMQEFIAASKMSRTTKLWKQYHEFIIILRLFIRAERTGDWNLHLYCVKKMIPIFAATGHNNYAKSSQIYLQNMLKMQNKMSQSLLAKFTQEGYFTIRRSSRFWSGLWSDLTIEQHLMRAIKSRGGLSRGRGLSDSVTNKWINSMPAATEYSHSIENMCGLRYETSEQHVDLQNSRQRYDRENLESFINYFKNHSPFNPNTEEIKSIASGLLGNDSTNCDQVELIGEKIISKLLDMKFNDVHFKKLDRVKNLAAVKISVNKIGEIMEPVDLMQLFNRIICLNLDETDLMACMGYELSPVAPSLFNDVGDMRTGKKSDLQDVIHNKVKNHEDCIYSPECNDMQYVIDGGYLLRKVIWTLPCTYGDAIINIITYIKKHYKTTITVIFDGYSNETTTKRSAHASRYKNCSNQEIFEFTEKSNITVSQSDFLSNSKNKEKFISLLSDAMNKSAINVKIAPQDADTLIATSAIKLASNTPVTVIANDTDILVLLTALSPPDVKIIMLSPSNNKKKEEKYKVFPISLVQKKLTIPPKSLLFLHAVSGCDTTSAIFRKGKNAIFKLLSGSTNLQSIALGYCEVDADINYLISTGELFLLQLYKSKESSLDTARYYAYISSTVNSKITSKFDLSNLPPTSAAAKQHLLRCYHQVQQWLGVELDPTNYGWSKDSDKNLSAIISDQPPIPPSIKELLNCECKTDCNSARCTCKKNGIFCGPACGHCRGYACANHEPLDYDSDPDADHGSPRLRQYVDVTRKTKHQAKDAAILTDSSDDEDTTSKKRRKIS